MKAAEEGIYGIIGKELSHSLTPRLMNHLAVLNDRPERFRAIEVEPSGLSDFFDHASECPRVMLNVTSPFKERVLNHLDYISGDAEDTQSVNIINGVKGELRGYNADIEGFMAPSTFLSQIKWENERRTLQPTALILGSGGAAAAAAVGLVRTWGVGRLVFLARNTEGLKRRVAHFSERYSDSHLEFFAAETTDEAREIVFRDDSAHRLLINATPIGQWPHKEFDPFGSFGLEDEDLIRFKYYYDAVYNPSVTAGALRIGKFGGITVGGIDWFCRQAVLSAEIFFDHRHSEDDVRSFVENELSRQ